MGRYSNLKVATFSKKLKVTDIGPEFKYFDMIPHTEGNYVTVVSHEYYRPRTRFRRSESKNKRSASFNTSNIQKGTGVAPTQGTSGLKIVTIPD